MFPLVAAIVISLAWQLAPSTAETCCFNNNTELINLINLLRNETMLIGDELIEQMSVLNFLILTAAHQILEGVFNNSIYNVYRYNYSPLLHSCEEIKSAWPNSSSGYYLIADGKGEIRHVFCEMETVCGSDGGWMRLAFLNMSDPAETCPSGFRLYDFEGLRSCGRKMTTSKFCQSVTFPSFSLTYSVVCGRVTGYQYASTDAFGPYNFANIKDIDRPYVDGVSLTHGSPRKHIWTFAAGIQENLIYDMGHSDCPCALGSRQVSPNFVGGDYFCESGSPGNWQANTFYPDPLWDGQDCGTSEQGCCSAPGLPWFYKKLTVPTNDYIELRLCSDQGTDNEDVPIGFYEIYVK